MLNESQETLDARIDALLDDHEQLLTALVQLRKQHNLSQELVADRMGISQPAVSQFERYDANPRLSTIRRYAMAVGARITTVVADDLPSTSSKTTPTPNTKAGPRMRSGL
jgi:transcriptional regulator with XRE-family HTH domain